MLYQLDNQMVFDLHLYLYFRDVVILYVYAIPDTTPSIWWWIQADFMYVLKIWPFSTSDVLISADSFLVLQKKSK